MRLKAGMGGIILSATITFLTAVTASAASINVTPSTVLIGGTVTVSGDVLGPNGQPGCAVPGTVTLISGAFAGQGNFQGQDVEAPVGADGKYSVRARVLPGVQPNTYTVTGRCGGGNLGVQATLVVTPGLPSTGREPAGQTATATSLGQFPLAVLTLIGGLTLSLLVGAWLARRRGHSTTP
jgi:hypothetical protein